MEGIDSPFADVPKVPAAEILELMKRIAAKHKEAEAIYMLGSAWKTLEIIEPLEKSTGLTVVHAGPARCWETQLRLGVRHSIKGYGKTTRRDAELDTPNLLFEETVWQIRSWFNGSPRTDGVTSKFKDLAVHPEALERRTANCDTVSTGESVGREIA